MNTTPATVTDIASAVTSEPAGPIPEPAAEPALEPAAEPTLEPAAEPTLEPAAERMLEPTLTIHELATQLHVAVQTLYDLRSQGRGPRGFRVGRHLRFRISAVETWLAGLEDEDRGAS